MLGEIGNRGEMKLACRIATHSERVGIVDPARPQGGGDLGVRSQGLAGEKLVRDGAGIFRVDVRCSREFFSWVWNCLLMPSKNVLLPNE